MSALLRLFATVATIVAVCFALAQVGGRVAFSQLARLEGAVNAVLAPRGVSVTGLEGRWRGLNPGLFAERVRFAGGEASGFDFELDVLESLGRNRLVARRLTVADGHLRFEKTERGWRLAGASGESRLDVRALVVHSDQIWLRGRLLFSDGVHVGALHVESMHVNEDGRHRFHTHVQSELHCEDCALAVEGDIRQDDLATARVTAQRFALGQELHAMLLSGVSPESPFANARIAASAEGAWQRDRDGGELARLDVALHAHGAGGRSGAIEAGLGAWKEAGADSYSGRLEHLTLASGDALTELTGGRFQLGGVDAGSPFADLRLPPFAIADVVAPLVAFYGRRHQSGLWLSRVQPAGDVDELILRIDGEGLAFAGGGRNGSLAGHKGTPRVHGIVFALGGHQRALRLGVEGRDFELGFPGYIDPQGPYQQGGGELLFAFSPGYVGMRGDRLTAVRDGSVASTRIALARPEGQLEVRVSADGAVNRVPVATARAYLPLGLAPNLRRWLLDAVAGGALENGRIVYHGHVRERDGLPLRRLEMAATIADAGIDYHEDWPAASRVDGVVEVAHDEVRLAGRAHAFGVDLEDVAVRVPRRGERIDLALDCATTVERLFAFARATPVRESMAFLSDDWHGTGNVALAAELIVPFRGGALRPGDVRLDMRFRDAVLDFADLGLRFEAVDKRVAFENPTGLRGETVRGELFGAPVEVAIVSDPETVRFSLTGTASAADAHRLLGIDDFGIAHGAFDFDAVFNVFSVSDRAMELHLESELLGLGLALPAPLGKAADEKRRLTASLQFLDPHVAVSVGYGESNGWLHVGDEGIRAGAVGIGAPIPMIDAERGRVVFGGGVDAIDTQTAEALMGRTDTGGVAWELRRFRIGALRFDHARFADLAVDGYSERGETHFALQAPDLEGTLSRRGDAPWRLHLRTLKLPAPEDEDADPLDTVLIDRLVAADVHLEQVLVGGEDFGTWRFGVRPSADGVALIDLVADVRGLHIESAGSHAFWSLSDETRFEGNVTAGDLQHVLPLWDFADSVVSERFESSGSLRWPGSPLNFDLAHLSGTASLDVANGSFLDVTSGGARIMSLINFSTIVKRMSLDFSDVFGQGVAFDRVLADLALDDGVARFTTPAQVKGTGSSFLITGTVDLDAGHLNNEMVVTLPLLNSNLPWYAAFLAFSNPAGAAGVWLGRQVFKDQIARLSSGKYRVGGTIEEPEVELVSIFDNDIAAPAPRDELGARQGAEMQELAP